MGRKTDINSIVIELKLAFSMKVFICVILHLYYLYGGRVVFNKKASNWQLCAHHNILSTRECIEFRKDLHKWKSPQKSRVVFIKLKGVEFLKMSVPLQTFSIGGSSIEFDLAAGTISKKVLEVVQCTKNKQSNFKVKLYLFFNFGKWRRLLDSVWKTHPFQKRIHKS